MDTALLLEWTIKSVILVLVMTGGFTYLTLFERRVLARMQVRIGPNRAGPFGLLQPIADAIKLVFKEELIPAGANKLIFVMAPIITVFPALVITAVIPWGETALALIRYTWRTSTCVLYITAIVLPYGITLAGWSSIMVCRAACGRRRQISYELALGAFVPPIMLAG
jgi:NADH-quinone oxidoreductase subunit H